jgi:arylsulfatase A-like enzyme/Flp pilus assembly protein TadD
VGRRRIAIAAWLLLTVSCGQSVNGPAASTDSKPVENVLLITVDTLRFDALGFSGQRPSTTPTLDRLAATGRVFTNAHAHSVMTLPSHTSILTGLYPYEHRVRDNAGFYLSDQIPTLASQLRAAGFSTAAFVGAYPLDSRFGLDQGFEVYDDSYGARAHDQVFVHSERPGHEVVSAALAWWRQAAPKRRFLWIHLFEPHAPYEPPEALADSFEDNPYLGEVAAADAYLAPLLEPFLAGKEPATLIIFTSDHGESLGEHGEATHGLFAYESTLRVPLVLWGPGVAAGEDSRPARHIDLAPTVLESVDSEVPTELPGRSLLPGGGADDASADGSYFESLSTNFTLGWAPLRGVIKDGKKFIDLPLPELYDLRDDPREQSNLIQEERRTAQQLRDLIPSQSAWPPAADDVPSEEVSRLRSLGYLTSRTARKDRYTEADDPKNLVELDHKINRVSELYVSGSIDEAIRLAYEISAARPDMPLPYSFLATMLVQKGSLQEALEVMQTARERGAAQPDLLKQLGLTLVWAGRPQEAVEVLGPLAESSNDPTARSHLAAAQAALGHSDEAMQLLEEVLRQHPDHAPAHDTKAYIALQRGDFPVARDAAQQAIAIDPQLASSWNNLGVALYNLGQSVPALEAWRRSLELNPQDYDTLFNYALIATEARKLTEARAALARFITNAPSPFYDPQRQQAREMLAQLNRQHPVE